jgi:predicted phosphodiesterase
MKKFDEFSQHADADIMSTQEIRKHFNVSERYARAMKAKLNPKASNKPVVSSTGQEKVFVLADIHLPYQSEPALKMAMDRMKAFAPDTIVLLGDVLDLYSVSFFKKDPHRITLAQEIAYASKWFIKLRNDYPECRIVFVEGNHEARLVSYIQTNSKELNGLDALRIESLLGLDGLNIEYVRNIQRLSDGTGAFKIGKLSFLHGHEVRASFGSVNLARLVYLKTQVPVIFGHFHKISTHITKRMDGKVQGAFSVGCLCHLSADYAPINEWTAGFAEIMVNRETGNFTVQNKLILGNEIM